MLQHLADSDDDEVGLGLVALTGTRSLIPALILTRILTPNEAAEAFGVVSFAHPRQHQGGVRPIYLP